MATATLMPSLKTCWPCLLEVVLWVGDAGPSEAVTAVVWPLELNITYWG